ncbi:hypothetical protein ABRP55_20230 [Pectobacterium zantedeschiae]|uniref:hypothetical protein n=1 Tax=Pectobacterium zantedeschiae TaxID=2034769 RepID=UPI0032EAD6A3
MKITDMLKIAATASSPWIIGIAFLVWLFSFIDSRIDAAAYSYPRTVVSYGLIAAKTDDEVISTVEVWKKDAWGAQIGALRVLCDSDRNYINSLGGEDVGARICRIVR